MRAAPVIFVGSVVVGCFVLAVDLLYGPSLSLLSANLTGLIIITLSCLAVFALMGPRKAHQGKESPYYRLRMPAWEMYVLLRGAREGYVSSRRRVARILADAAKARLDTGRRAPSDGEVDAFLRESLGSSFSPQIFPADTGNPARLPSTGAYVAALKEALSRLEQGLGGRS